jgi:hypothetical protein
VLGFRVFRSAEAVHSSGIRKRFISHAVSDCEATQRPTEQNCNEHVTFQIRTLAFWSWKVSVKFPTKRE